MIDISKPSSGLVEAQPVDGSVDNEMAERVLRGMSKWPDVPAVYNWLSLDRRGRWLMKSSEITHPLLLGFINQHYFVADDGSYYFQNGPQQVFIELEITPYVFGLAGNKLLTQNHLEVGSVEAAWLSDQGDLLLQTDLGPGLIDDRYLAQVEEWVMVDGDRDQVLAQLLAGDNNLSVRLTSELVGFDLPLLPISSNSLETVLGFIARPTPPDDDKEYCVE
ncbi:MAG: DUF2946 family protein [Immundisolibacteraceae bacterium]|nr:DUF2946 family protein [Immundisolibacteraceae bacterium]